MIARIMRFLFGEIVRNEGTLRKKLNIKKDANDDRDFKVKSVSPAELKGTVNLLDDCVVAVKSQGSIGSCGSHAIVTAVEMMLRMRRNDDFIEGSELAHYYFVRSLEYENSLPRDAGQSLRMGCKVVEKIGMVPESLCPYNVDNYNDQPSTLARSFGRWWKVKSYVRCFDINAILTALNNKQPVVVGLSVWREFLRHEGDEVLHTPTGFLPVGGHAVTFIGYDLKSETFLFVNSWGRSWGSRGFGRIGFDDVRRTLIDAWTFEV